MKKFFGGKVESAKTDERKEFKTMLEFIKKDESISAILVYSYERFSRSEYAMQLIMDLAKIGVRVLSVLQDVDVTTSAGKFQQTILFAVGNYDNAMRRDKCVRGMVENLLNGYWVGSPPFGYTNLNKKEKAKYHNYVINKDGEILKLGFKYKAEGKLSNMEIVQKMRAMGSTINYKSFVRIISNPFYCGFITHGLIADKVVKGHHPPLVTEALFIKANNVVSTNPHKGIAKKQKNIEIPLKSFLRNELDNVQFTGYLKKGNYYYKTRTGGIAINERADVVNGLFIEELKKYSITSDDIQLIEEQVKQKVYEKLKDETQASTLLKRKITELNEKIEKLEIRFVEEEINKDLFKKYTAQYSLEKEELMTQLHQKEINSSNLEKAIQKAVAIASKPLQIWLSADYDDKQKLQYLMFPEGLLYNKEKRAVRTPRINSLFALISSSARVIGENKKDYSVKSSLDSHLVVSVGIEPTSKV